MTLAHRRNGLWQAAVLFILVLLATPALADKKPRASHAGADPMATLDSRFQSFSTGFYAKLARLDDIPRVDTMNALVQTIDADQAQHHTPEAIATVVRNLPLIEKNADTTPMVGICRLLFEANEWNTASHLYADVKKHGDAALASNVTVSLVRHHFDRQQWKETITLVEGLRRDLPPEDYSHALLMSGIALQELRRHRQALTIYGRIPPSSRYYVAARLNMAVANIRQDWWTDAHEIINNLLTGTDRKLDDELSDRLYTVLGYSMLQQGYYRDSREAFRNVSLNGQYANKALLGIALTAAYQKDYVGALNATSVLKTRKQHDLSADEATLLTPYFYERLQQLDTATAGFADAVNFYETRVQAIRDLPIDGASIAQQLAATDVHVVAVGDELIDLGAKLPSYILHNVRRLNEYQSYVERIASKELSREYESVRADYQRVLGDAARQLLAEKTDALTHYMNQSRYGLARMQDHEATGTAIPQ